MNEADRAGEPLVYVSGKVIFSEQLKADPVFLKAVPLLEGNARKAQDLGNYLFFMLSPSSMMRNIPEEERLKRLLAEGRIAFRDWFAGIIRDPRILDLCDHYARLVMSPGERLRLGLVEAVDKLLKDLSGVRAEDDLGKAFDLIEKGKKLHQYAKDIQAMITEEKKRKVKGGYQPRRLERRRQDPHELLRT
jgi:hypothetical protein